MTLIPGGDAMIARFHRDAEAAAKREKLRSPGAWYLHQADTDWFTDRRKHCQQRRCRGPVEVVTHRDFRRGGQVLQAEHFWCRSHGREFASRWGIEVEVESDRSARYLTASEAAAAAGQECDTPSCHRVPACVFTEAFLLRGEPAATEHPFCGEHGWLMAVRWRIDIAAAGPEGGQQ
jgi:hypothetical protein